ncbi:MAG: competence/damage-inducible protein A [Dehalococcoidia bacterium]|nr:competence/damage-inducible protein A [Dehalococcoidia bacterium]
MRAEIISIGTEILLGEILDTNAQYIAARLPALGIDLYWMTQVGDNVDRLREALRRAWERSDLILTTGGLGPTEDDLTREAIAATLDEPLSVDSALEAQVRALFASRGIVMPERNVKQAALIASARAIANPHGTAPGWWVEREGRILVAMPGPPAEMERMWEKEVAPRLAKLATGGVIVSRTLKTVGIGEGGVDEMVSPLLGSTNPSVAVYAKADGVHLRITAKAASRDEAQRLIAPMEEQARGILGNAIWGADDETLEAVVGAMLQERGLSVATMESCTGGLLASTITDVAGSSSYFKGGFVAYTAEMKIALGVDEELIRRHGVVSQEVALDMARAARERLGADLGIGVTGVAGPEPLEDKPVGTVHIALDDGRAPQAISYAFAQSRAAIKRRAVTTALALLRRAVLGR